jgi:hypothetical protein
MNALTPQPHFQLREERQEWALRWECTPRGVANLRGATSAVVLLAVAGAIGDVLYKEPPMRTVGRSEAGIRMNDLTTAHQRAPARRAPRSILGAFQRRQDPVWKRHTPSVR